MSWLFLALATAFNSAGNVLIKMSAQEGGGLSPYLTPTFIIGAGLFGLNLIAYTKAQTTIPLSVAYSLLMGGTMVAVTLFGVYYFQEAMTGVKLAGLAFVFLGVVLLVL